VLFDRSDRVEKGHASRLDQKLVFAFVKVEVHDSMCVPRAHNVNHIIVAFCCESRSCACGDPFGLSNWDGLAGRCTQGTTYYLIEVHLGVDRTGEIKARLDNDRLEPRGAATSARSRCYAAAVSGLCGAARHRAMAKT
jgi:hypothetical protein